MTTYRSLADLLGTKFPGLSQRKIAHKLGVDSSTVTRWFRDKGGQPPTLERCLKIAMACQVDPQLVFSLAGREEEYGALFDYYAREIPDIGSLYPTDHRTARLMKRADRLLRRGWHTRFDSKLSELESYWEVNRSGFESLVRRYGGSKAFLMLSHPGIERDIVYAFGCDENQARAVASGEDDTGWQSYAHADKRLSVILYLLSSTALNRTEAEPVLAAWCASFISLLDAESTARRR